MNIGKMATGAALAVAMAASAASIAHADALTGDFVIKNGASSASGGNVTFTLNGDGTIGASLVDISGSTIVGFGFDSISVNLPESSFNPTLVDNPDGWLDLYGAHHSGFLCTACGTSESWTIGNPGDFTSVFQALGGGNASSAFMLYDNNGDQWAANAGVVPEPSTWAMMIVGLAGLGGALRASRRNRTALA